MSRRKQFAFFDCLNYVSFVNFRGNESVNENLKFGHKWHKWHKKDCMS
jgi:hypothetical protein